jgi:hypothetical protein
MDPAALIQSLDRSGRVLSDFFAGLSPEEARWKPAPEKWSMLEVLNHLIDEERDDFRKRVDLTLRDPEEPWPPIDPEGWARDRNYNARDLAASAVAFREERRTSLEWLLGLDEPPWKNEHRHPKIGGLRAGDLLASWAAHDLLHARQLVNLRLEYLRRHADPYSIDYASP